MLTLNIVIGLSQAPFRVEIATLGAQKVDNEYFCMQDIKGKRILAKAGMTLLSNKDDAIEVGPAFGTHSYMDGLFDSEGSNQGCFTLYFADYTQWEHTFTFRNAVYIL